MPELPSVVIIGAGGLGQEVAWAAANCNLVQPTFRIVGYCDDDEEKKGQAVGGIPVLGNIEAAAPLMPEPPCFICAVGSNTPREQLVLRALAVGWTPISVVDPSVIRGSGSTVGGGCYVAPGAILAPDSQVGDHVIVNLHASVGHNAVVEAYAHICPGARISGFGRVGRGAFLGSNAAVGPGIRVGAGATLGACSFAAANVPDGVTALGVPAHVVWNHQ